MVSKSCVRAWKFAFRMEFTPPPLRYGPRTRCKIGISVLRSVSEDRKPSATKSSISPSQFWVPKWTTDETMMFLSATGTSATSPKSSRHNFPASGPSTTFSRLPGCGSPWKKPISSSCVRNSSWPTATNSLISSWGRALSFTPLTHRDTITRRVVSASSGSGMTRRAAASAVARSRSSASMRRALSASFLKSSSVYRPSANVSVSAM
mmetsp:Transcript_87562/g.267918  ORF Transcript_87562/g.267918 Transcript_87562/m.267918 type:complete len:207 (+) Transcript_87562:302-922(+)